MFVQGPVAAPEVWIWKAVAYAASQRRITCPMVAVEPRSTWIHCGSDAALDQRVPALPSTPLAQGVPAFSTDEQVTALFSARLPPGTGVLVRVAVGPTAVFVGAMGVFVRV